MAVSTAGSVERLTPGEQLHGQTNMESIAETEEVNANLCIMPSEIEGYRPEPTYRVRPFASRSDRVIVAVCKLPETEVPVLGDLERELDLTHFKELSTALETQRKIESRKQARDPMPALLRPYWLRKDLQNAFPEVASGEYTGLLNWARATATHKRDDSYRSLASFEYWYKTNFVSELTSTRDHLDALLHPWSRQLSAPL